VAGNEIWVWPQVISVNGITLFRQPISRNAPQGRGSRGNGNRRAATTSHNRRDAQPTRCSTAVSGPISRNAKATEKNIAPQITERSSNTTHARVDRSGPVLILSATRLLPPAASCHRIAGTPIRRPPGSCDHASCTVVCCDAVVSCCSAFNAS
jgi:hypothetical protein